MSLSKWVRWQTVNGETITVHSFRLTPQIQTVQLTLPFAGFVWSRPSAILVRQGTRAQRIPIVDITRIAQVGFYLLAIVLYLRRKKALARDNN